MTTLTKDDILRRAQSESVHFVRLQFTDILGIVKNVAIPVSQLESALDDQILFDGSSIEGFTRIEESDMSLRPDYATFCTFPWRTDEHGSTVARLICDVYKPDGEPFEGDPRRVLRRAIQKAAELGFEVNVGAECEFFLFKRTAEGKPTTITHDEGGYFDLGPIDRGEDARRDIVVAMEAMGYTVDASHHEVAPGQHEIGFHYNDALKTADLVTTFKIVTRAVAARHGLHATFMPKPIFGVNGSGMHTHFSLFTRDGENAFYNSTDEFQLSRTARAFIAGLLLHAPAITALANPLINSYKRLLPGYEAPTYIAWSAQNRSALVRVPAPRKQATRLEFRSPDPSCNPYLALAAMIRAGLDGVERDLVPPPSLDRNIYDMSTKELAAYGVQNLPDSLPTALVALEQDELLWETLGPHIASRYIEAKSIEWDVYRSQVHPWELEQYLGQF